MSSILSNDLTVQGNISYTSGTNLPSIVQPRLLYAGTSVFTTGTTTSYTISTIWYYAVIKSGLVIPTGYNYLMITVTDGDYLGASAKYSGTIKNNGNGTWTAGMTIHNYPANVPFRVNWNIYAIV